jgi:hypothetical protein
MERKKSYSNERRTNCNLCSRTIVLKILIAGDSFAAQWPGDDGWVKLLAQKHDVTNVAQAGVSEYKILKQLKTVNLDDYDAFIVSHTSPSRVHTLQHPLHKEGLHKDCDLIWTDLEGRNSFLNPSLKAAQGYFQYHYDDHYYQTIYSLFRKEIYTILHKKKYISLSHVDIAKAFVWEDNHIDFSDFWKKHKGKQNHYSVYGNDKIYKIILDKLKKL